MLLIVAFLVLHACEFCFFFKLQKICAFNIINAVTYASIEAILLGISEDFEKLSPVFPKNKKDAKYGKSWPNIIRLSTMKKSRAHIFIIESIIKFNP